MKINTMEEVELIKGPKDKVIDLIGDIRTKSVDEILREAGVRYKTPIRIPGVDILGHPLLDKDGNPQVDKGGHPLKINRSYRGFVYERLWDICIKFGCVDNLTMKNGEDEDSKTKTFNTCHIFGNPNQEGIDYDQNFWSGGAFKGYLDERVQSGNSGGYSDISFINKTTTDVTDASNVSNVSNAISHEDLYFISVKYYAREHAVGDYDIGKLCTLIEKHGKPNRKIHVFIFVKDKTDLIKKFRKAQRSSDIMMKYIDPAGDQTFPNIYDQQDLVENISKLKAVLGQYNYLQGSENKHEFETVYLRLLKSPFIPRFHQKLFIDKINELVIKYRETQILVGAIPRSGKSYIMGGVILDYLKKTYQGGAFKNFLMITPAPTETFGEYKKLFDTHIDFQASSVAAIYMDGAGRKRGLPGKEKQEGHRVYIASKQLLGWTPPGKKDEDSQVQGEIELKVKDYKNVKRYFEGVGDFDLIFLDEAHFGLSTTSSKLILDEINKLSPNAITTPKIFVTATYNKPSRIYSIKEKCKLTWDINDIQIMKDLTSGNYKNNYIRERFGAVIYDRAIKEEGGESAISRLKNQYDKFPKPYLITSVWDKKHLDNEQGKLGDSGYGFDMNELFKNDGSNFTSEHNVIEMMKYYFGVPDKKADYDIQAFYRNRGILPRIKRICSNGEDNGCRTCQTNSRYKTSQLWFLPYGPGNKIAGVVNSLLTLLNGKNEFRDIKDTYHFFVAVEDGSWTQGSTKGNITYMSKPSEIKKDILKIEKSMMDGSMKADNLIILAGARLQLGISFENVDIVALWNTVTSTDANFQMLFRSMTEKPTYENCRNKEYCNNKKYGFMVDLNPQRALTSILLFEDSIRAKNKNLTDKERNIELSKLINIDEDVMMDKYSGEESKRGEFVTELFNKFYSSWDESTKTIQKTAKNFSYDKQLLQSIETQLRNIKLAKGNKIDKIVDPEDKFDGPIRDKPKSQRTKTEQDQDKVKEIPIEDMAAEALSDIITLMNIYTIYLSEEAECILLENRTIPEVVNNIGDLKHKIFADSELKESFLDVLNMRLGGHGDNSSLEHIIDILSNSLTSDEDLISMNRIIMGQKKQIYTIKDPKKLLEYINDNLTPKEKERKEKGEVFTPIYIVEEMLDKLPKHVWSDHTLKWLDPAVGMGNFPICAYLRLMEGLKSWESNEEKRRKYIIEKMLYMVEISKKSITILDKIFCGNKYKLNIFPKSFFDYKETGFDIIMGNPPYNEGGTGRTSGSRQPLWPKFVDQSLLAMNDERQSYLLFIHPSGWRKPYSSDMHKNIGRIFYEFNKSGSLLYIKMTDETIPHFPPVDIYLYTNKKNRPTIVDSSINGNTFTNQSIELSKLDTGNIGFIPSILNKNIINIITKTFKNKNDNELYKIEYDGKLDANQGMRKNTAKGFPYAFYHDNGKYVEIYNKDIGQDKDYFKKPKIIMTFNGSSPIGKLYPVYYKKPIGTTTYTLYYLTDDDEKGITKHINFFDSKLILFLMIITQYSPVPRNKNDQKILNNIQIPNLPSNPTDDDIYKYYGITKEEQKLIDEVVNYTKPTKRTPKKDKMNFNVKPSKKEIDYNHPKYEGMNDPAPAGSEPEPEPLKEPKRLKKPEPLKKPRKEPEKKKVTKSKCTSAHKQGPPCDTGQYPKPPNNCCYKDKPKLKKKAAKEESKTVAKEAQAKKSIRKRSKHKVSVRKNRRRNKRTGRKFW
tara:strand:- start:6988 stop:12111 length:5124 start_codon:yes stop_codon:yes gene_type:complete